jgi:hypothetical protein
VPGGPPAIAVSPLKLSADAEKLIATDIIKAAIKLNNFIRFLQYIF